MNKKGLEIQKKIILDNFDFIKVYKHMVMTNWEWDPIGDVPTPDQAKEVATRHLDEVITRYLKENRGTLASSGGFLATITDFEGEVVLELLFKVTEFSMYDIKTEEEIDMYNAIYNN